MPKNSFLAFLVGNSVFKKMQSFSSSINGTAYTSSNTRTYIHLGHFLKTNFGYTGSEVIYHNLKVGIVYLICCAAQTYWCYKIHPLKILKIRTSLFCVFILLYPFLFSNISAPFHLFLFQAFLMSAAPSDFPAVAVFFKYFPVFKRFTYTSILHAVSHTLLPHLGLSI